MPHVLALLDLIPFLGAAGGGSSGFSGGGGGGGGGGSSFSGGGSSGSGTGEGSPWIVVVVVAVFLVVFVIGWVSAWRLRRRRAERVRRVTAASAEAAEDDAHFEAATVVAQAGELFTTIQNAWGRNDVATLRGLVGADLMVEWERRLADFAAKDWRNVVEVRQGPEVEYIGLVNREDDAQDRVCVRVSATLLDYVQTGDGKRIERDGATSTEVAHAEYWTLEHRDGGWRLLSIEEDAEGVHQLDADIVPTPWSDTTALRGEALVEGAVADKVLPGFAVSELVDVDLAGDARTQALDLALVDGRFAPDVLEVVARRAVAAWLEAVDGQDAALLALADPQAAATLLYGGDGSGRTRVVVRGAAVERIGIDGLEPGGAGVPARMTVTVVVRGRRYVEDRDTAAVLSGDKDGEQRFTERWTMALADGDDATPWRLVGVDEPVAG